jgi:HSP20 family molecular chaperone IbpA
VKKDNIQIDIEGDTLKLSVKAAAKTEEESGEMKVKDESKVGGTAWERQRRERMRERWTSFAPRSIRLPTSADLDSISASYVDGVLMIHVPKKAEARRRQVNID